MHVYPHRHLLNYTMIRTSRQTNTPIHSCTAHLLPYRPIRIHPTPGLITRDPHGEEELLLRKRAMPMATIMENRVVYGKSCLINGGKLSALGVRIWMEDTRTRMMEDRLDERIRLNDYTFSRYTTYTPLSCHIMHSCLDVFLVTQWNSRRLCITNLYLPHTTG